MEADSEQGHMRAAIMVSKVDNGPLGQNYSKGRCQNPRSLQSMHMSQIWIHPGIAQGAYLLLEGNLGV